MLLTNSLNRIEWKIVLCSHQRLEQFIFCINKTVRIHEGEFLSTGHNEKLFLTVLMIFFHSVYFCLYEAKVGFGNTESNQDLKFWHKQMNSRVVNVKWYHLVLEIPVSSSTWGLLQCRCGRDTSLPELLQFLGLQCQKEEQGSFGSQANCSNLWRFCVLKTGFLACTGFYGITISTRPRNKPLLLKSLLLWLSYAI